MDSDRQLDATSDTGNGIMGSVRGWTQTKESVRAAMVNPDATMSSKRNTAIQSYKSNRAKHRDATSSI